MRQTPHLLSFVGYFERLTPERLTRFCKTLAEIKDQPGKYFSADERMESRLRPEDRIRRFWGFHTPLHIGVTTPAGGEDLPRKQASASNRCVSFRCRSRAPR